MPDGGHDQDGVRMTSAQVAARLGITVGSVYKLRTGRRGFPQPVGYSGASPMFAADAIEEYVRSRSDRQPSDRGRRPRMVAEGAIDSTLFAERLRARIQSGAGRPGIATQADLIARLGLNIVTFGHRMRGRTRWKSGELEIVADVLGMDTADANDAVDAARGARQ